MPLRTSLLLYTNLHSSGGRPAMPVLSVFLDNSPTDVTVDLVSMCMSHCVCRSGLKRSRTQWEPNANGIWRKPKRLKRTNAERLIVSLHSSHEPSELSHWLWRDDSVIILLLSLLLLLLLSLFWMAHFWPTDATYFNQCILRYTVFTRATLC